MPYEYHNVTIESIDEAIHSWFDKTVDSHVESPNGDRKKVPVLFGAGERSVTSRTKKAIRDKNGVLILPLINVRRTSLEPNTQFQALGVETPTLTLSRQVNSKTNNIQNLLKDRTPSLRESQAPIFEIITMPFPDSCVFYYELSIQTQYITQMNTILEKIVNQLDIQKQFVAPFDNFNRHPPIGEDFEAREPIKGNYVCGFFESSFNDQSNFEEFTDQERIHRYSTQIKVPAVLMLDPEGEKPAIQKNYTTTKLNFKAETVYSAKSWEELELVLNFEKNGKKFSIK
jgi:hypothetical protein